MLAAADAVFDAGRALRRAADTVDQLGDLAASSLRVLEDAATDTFYAHQEDRGTSTSSLPASTWRGCATGRA